MIQRLYLSDIGIHIGLFDLLMFAILTGWPGILFGGVSGAILWHSRRITGALLGAISGWPVGVGLFIVWSDSNLSRNLDYGEAMTWMALIWFMPGWCVGAASGGALWHGQRATGIVGGGVIGALAGIAGWALIALSGR